MPKITGWSLIRLYTILVYVFMFAPIVVVVVLSFNPEQFGSFPMRGFSFRWFVKLAHNQTILVPEEDDVGVILHLLAKGIHGRGGFLAPLLVDGGTPARHVVGLQGLRNGFLEICNQGIEAGPEELSASGGTLQRLWMTRLLEVEPVTPARRSGLVLGPHGELAADEGSAP